ncbi:MAG: hypothetical protein NTW62_00075 [Candidatus Nomurabacteria bacterium]|nr:hypothetical protein [Candidatus Nomurabacteria bacterium]
MSQRKIKLALTPSTQIMVVDVTFSSIEDQKKVYTIYLVEDESIKNKYIKFDFIMKDDFNTIYVNSMQHILSQRLSELKKYPHNLKRRLVNSVEFMPDCVRITFVYCSDTKEIFDKIKDIFCSAFCIEREDMEILIPEKVI